jgi:hypothetical protein
VIPVFERDHPWHKYLVLGGMWGAKKGVLPNMKDLVANFTNKHPQQYGLDYHFFQEIYPLIQNNILVHDEFFGGRSFPIPRNGLEFVGEVFDEFGRTVPEHTEALRRHLEAK